MFYEYLFTCNYFTLQKKGYYFNHLQSSTLFSYSPTAYLQIWGEAEDRWNKPAPAQPAAQGAKLQNRLGKKHNTHAAEWRKTHMNVIILNKLKRSVFGHSPVTVIGVIMCQNCKEWLLILIFYLHCFHHTNKLTWRLRQF